MPQKYSRELSFFDSRDNTGHNIGCQVKLPFPDGEHKQTWYNFTRERHELSGSQLSLVTKLWGHLADGATLEQLTNVIRDTMLTYDEGKRPIDRMRKVFREWEKKGLAKGEDVNADIGRLSLKPSRELGSGHFHKDHSEEKPQNATADKPRSNSRTRKVGAESSSQENPIKGPSRKRSLPTTNPRDARDMTKKLKAGGTGESTQDSGSPSRQVPENRPGSGVSNTKATPKTAPESAVTPRKGLAVPVNPKPKPKGGLWKTGNWQYEDDIKRRELKMLLNLQIEKSDRRDARSRLVDLDRIRGIGSDKSTGIMVLRGEIMNFWESLESSNIYIIKKLKLKKSVMLSLQG